MKFFPRSICYGLSILLVLGVMSLQVMAEEKSSEILQAKEFGAAIGPEPADLLFPDAISNLQGFASLGNDPNAPICFDATPQNTFAPGDQVWLNVFFFGYGRK